MEDFVKYLTDIVEFLVGGVLIATTIIVSALLFFPAQLSAAANFVFGVPDSLGAVVSLSGFALIFGLGVIVEGVSRAVVEWRLDRVTLACFDDSLPGRDHLSRSAKMRWAVETREEWRAVVEADDAGFRTVMTQLSRLRVERTFLLTGYILMVAFALKSFLVSPVAVNGYGLAAVLMLAFSILLFNLVNTRFKRYVNSIIREYRRVSAAASAPTSEG